MRSAQQAYRKRKEDTIDTLRNRVHQLEDGVEKISHSFLAFSSLLLETDVVKQDSRVALTLRETVEQCLALAKTGYDDLEERAHLSVSPSTNDDVEQSSMQSDSHLDVPEISEISATRYHSPMKQSTTPLPNTQRSLSPVQSTFPFSTTPSTCHASPTVSFSSYFVPNFLFTSTRNEGNDFSRFLIKVCCQSAYQLLVNTPNDMKVQEIFGTFLSPMEQTMLISLFCEGLQDRSGELVDQMATIFAPIQTKRHKYIPEQLSMFHTASNSAAMMCLDDLMDASDVQAMLVGRGFFIEEMAHSSVSRSLSSRVNVETFAKCKLIVTQKTSETY